MAHPIEQQIMTFIVDVEVPYNQYIYIFYIIISMVITTEIR